MVRTLAVLSVMCLASDSFAQTKSAAPKRASESNQASPAAGAAGAGIGLLGFACIGIASLLFYFLPSFVAGMRGHQNTPAVVVLNIFLGWTFVGWVVALVWSFTAVENRRRYYRED